MMEEEEEEEEEGGGGRGGGTKQLFQRAFFRNSKSGVYELAGGRRRGVH